MIETEVYTRGRILAARVVEADPAARLHLRQRDTNYTDKTTQPTSDMKLDSATTQLKAVNTIPDPGARGFQFEPEQENRELRRRLEAAERRDWTSTTAIKALRRAADVDRAWPAL